MNNLMVLRIIFIAGLTFVSGCAGLHRQRVTVSPESAPCVMVEAMFIEISEEDLNEFGFDWTPVGLEDSAQKPKRERD